MLSELIINNFQSHKETELTLSPNVNVIIGSSDSGKTAILRALRWLMWNRPIGDAFRSTWGGNTEVAVQVDGKYILRVKNKNENMYAIEETAFSAIKTDVPDEIIKMLNINSINLQSQFDRPFLLDMSPVAVAQFFNTIAHIDSIDTGLYNVQSWIRDINSKIGFIEDEQIKLKELIETQFSNVDELDAAILKLENKEQKCVEAEEDLENLSKLYASILDIKDDISGYNSLLKHEEKVTHILELFDSVRNKNGYLYELHVLVENINDTNRDVNDGNSNIKTMQNKFNKEFPDRCPLCGKIK
jgi:DNA repair protein SbcC/Rad50